jgi:hypothetical protein
MRWTNTTATLTVAFLMGVSAAESQPAQGPASLARRWRLNPERSEDARTKLREAGGNPGGTDMPAGAGAGGAGGGGGGRGGEGGRGAGGDTEGPLRPGTTPEQRRRQREAMQVFLNAPPGFVIAMNGDVVAVVDATGSVTELRPDGRTVKTDAGGTIVTQKAEWKGKRLVTETRVGEGPKIVVTYELAASGRELIVTTRTDTPRNISVSVKRVYDAVEG